ncbi:MAG TPA: S8 family serine peptidase [Blastocatellia bacterium]|nr:S8 family serine peptidase [Blastocatellia bacterium]
MRKNQLEIQVTDEDSNAIECATVIVNPQAKGPTVEAEFDDLRMVYFVEDLRPGFFEVDVSHPQYQREVRVVQVHPRPTRVRFLLMPLNARAAADNDVGIIFASAEIAKQGALEDLRALFKQIGKVPDWLPAAPENLAFSKVVIPPITEITIPPDHSFIDGLQRLRESQYVAAAGQFFYKSDSSFIIFTDKLKVSFRPEVPLDEITEILEQQGLTILEAMSFAPNLFLVKAETSIRADEIKQKSTDLLRSASVNAAEPNFAQWPGQDSYAPNDFLWPACWDRHLVCVEEAWEELSEIDPEFRFGRPEIIIAVVDSGIKSRDGDAEHPDLRGMVSNNTKKVTEFFDFSNMVPNNDCPAATDAFLQLTEREDECSGSAHGVKCAGIAAASADNPVEGQEVALGLAGAAPNVRLMGIIFPFDDALLAQTFDWAAGQPTRSSAAGFPGPAKEGADVITCSIPFGEGAPIPVDIQAMLDHITRCGRKGKGCIAIFSAGDFPRDIFTDRPYGAYEKAFSCAASTLDEQGNEVRAQYSGWGEVAWCVPSSSDEQRVHNPPKCYAVYSTCFLGAGDVPAFPEFSTSLSNDVSGGGPPSIFVQDVGPLKRDDSILIGNPGVERTENTKITADPNPATGEIKVQVLKNDHYKDEPVFSGPNDYTSRFGETSAAAPLSAGICALVLSANPDLTWVEAREILRSTACKIDQGNIKDDPIAPWFDEDGCHIGQFGKPAVRSNGYGYGRLNAYEAVKAARAYKFTRDLMIRKNLRDTGRRPTAPSVHSPDIWVRNADPAIDYGALPGRFDIPGPHQDPVRSKERWIYARIKNRGSEASLDAWVRFYLALSEVEEFPFPESWEPRNGTGNLTRTDWELGTYFIGEVALPTIQAGANLIVNMPWPQEMLPIRCVSSHGTWAFYLLVEITPQDGPLKGIQVHNNNNLAVKVISVVD